MSLAALFTALAAIATAWMAVSTNKLATTTKASVAMAEKAFEREKDGLLPLLQLTWTVAEETDGRGEHPFELVMKNVGVGPAFVREITVRNEVNRPAVYHSPLRRATISPGEIQRGVLDKEPGYLLAGPRFSSVSVWYQDVYDRWYRSRILFLYDYSMSESVDTVIALFEELHRPSDKPPYSWDTVSDPCPPNYVGLAEHGRCIPWNPLQVGEEWHTLDARARAQSIVLAAHPVAGRQSIAVRDMGFWSDSAWPQFTIQVGRCLPVALVVRPTGTRNPSAKDITALTTEIFPRAWSTSLPPPVSPDLPDLDWNHHGLVLGPRLQEELWELYLAIWRAVEGRIVARPPSGPC